MKSRSIVIFCAMVATGGFAAWKFFKPKPAPAPAPRVVNVHVENAATRDVPIWLLGLGTVQANNSVLVRPQVGGALQSIDFTEGQELNAGAILARIDPRPYQAALDQALAQKAQADAQNANDQREFERIRGLVASNTESRQLLDQREASLAQSAALQKAAQAAIDTARLNLDFTTLRAPIGGHTGVRLLDVGNLVTANQSNGLVVITQIKPISVVFTLPQQTFLDIRRGITAAGDKPLRVEALDDAGRVLATGRLELIDNQIDTSTGTLRLKASFPNDDQTLWPGQFVNARVLVETLGNALTVPAEAVQPGLDGPFAYVVKGDSTVEARQLKLGPTVDSRTVITFGLNAGDRVVSEGQNKLQPGARVKLADDSSKTSPATTNGATPAKPTATAAAR